MIRPLHLLALFPLLATASAGAASPFVQPPAYKECSGQAKNDPRAALQKANEWLAIDDSFTAHHCRAMALYAMRDFEQAAQALELVRSKILPEQIALRTYVARQAADAWEQAAQSDKALALLSTQIGEMGIGKSDNATEARLSAQLLLDRARLRLHFGQETEAVQDLDHAISLSPLNEDVLMQRALAFEQLGDKALATQDAKAVLRLKPGHEAATALLERLK